MPGDLPDYLLTGVPLGYIDSIDPTLETYPVEASPDLENIRVTDGIWKCRLGMASSIAAVGSGAGRFLSTLYLDTGARHRLMARGNTTAGVLYKLLVGTDATWQAVTSGTGLGNSDGEIFQGVANGGKFYLTDRQNALKAYNPASNTLESVAQPVAPTVAPNVRPRTYALFDGFTGAEPYGWTESDAANFELRAYTAGDLPGAGSYGTGTVRELLIDSTGALGDTISKDRQKFPVPSLAIAVWMEATSNKGMISIDFGIGAPAQFSPIINTGEADTTVIVFLPIGSIGTLSYFRFRCIRDNVAVHSVILGPLMLPGNLSGLYRWVYTHYDPVTGEESGPSPFSGGGEFSNFSQEGISYNNTTAEGEGSALYKSAVLDYTSDSGTDSSTTMVRWYRQGGTPELTVDGAGQDVLVRVGEIPDVVTLLNGAEAAAQTEIKLDDIGTAGGNLADGDGLVFEKGVAGAEEYGRIQDYRYYDLVIDAVTNTKVTSATRPFDSDDAGGVLVVQGGTGFTAGTYNISSVAGNVATLSAAVGTTGSTGGYGYLEAVNSTSKRVILADGLTYAHGDNSAVQACFIDNVANAAVDTSNVLDKERDNPPSGVRFVDRAPDGRLLLFGWPDRPMGIAYSNKPTVERPKDFEVFPDGVDPFTRRSLTQGFRFDLSGDASGDSIVWGGMFQQNVTALTRKALWQVYAGGQSDFGPTSVVRREEIGCIAGDTVQVIGDYLYWVAPGPRVVRWSGQGDPQDISFQRVSATLAAAPTGYYASWWAEYHADLNGAYYRLWIVPSGATAPTLRLDYNLAANVWEPIKYYDSGGTALPFACGTVLDVSSDVGEMLALHATSGVTYQQETGSTDAGEVIRVRFATKRLMMGGYVALVKNLWLRLAAATDTFSVSVLTGGSQYGNVTNAYSSLSSAGTGDVEVKQRVAFNQKGRWVQLTVTGSLSNRASLRELGVWFSRIRSGKVQ